MIRRFIFLKSHLLDTHAEVVSPEIHKERCFPPGRLLWFTLEVEVFSSVKMNQQEEQKAPGSQSWHRTEGATVQACCAELAHVWPCHVHDAFPPSISFCLWKHPEGRAGPVPSASLKDSSKELYVKTTFQSRNTDTHVPSPLGVCKCPCVKWRGIAPPNSLLERNTGNKILHGRNVVAEGLCFPRA